MNHDLFNSELGLHPWDDLRQCSEQWRQDVVAILTDLRAAQSEAEASEAYFRLEGACFPQRNITESCSAVVSCLLAGLAARPPGFVTGWMLEALRGIIGGQPIESEIERGNLSLMEDCRRAATPGLWLLLGLVPQCSGPDLENLLLVLSELDPTRRERLE